MDLLVDDRKLIAAIYVNRLCFALFFFKMIGVLFIANCFVFVAEFLGKESKQTCPYIEKNEDCSKNKYVLCFHWNVCVVSR
jgi:hypothetical protein